MRLNGGGTFEINQESRLFLATDPNVCSSAGQNVVGFVAEPQEDTVVIRIS